MRVSRCAPQRCTHRAAPDYVGPAKVEVAAYGCTSCCPILCNWCAGGGSRLVIFTRNYSRTAIAHAATSKAALCRFSAMARCKRPMLCAQLATPCVRAAALSAQCDQFSAGLRRLLWQACQRQVGSADLTRRTRATGRRRANRRVGTWATWLRLGRVSSARGGAGGIDHPSAVASLAFVDSCLEYQFTLTQDVGRLLFDFVGHRIVVAVVHPALALGLGKFNDFLAKELPICIR